MASAILTLIMGWVDWVLAWYRSEDSLVNASASRTTEGATLDAT